MHRSNTDKENNKQKEDKKTTTQNRYKQLLRNITNENTPEAKTKDKDRGRDKDATQEQEQEKETERLHGKEEKQKYR